MDREVGLNFQKTAFFLLFLACGNEDPFQSQMASTNEAHVEFNRREVIYSANFKYKVTQCQGPHAERAEGLIKTHPFNIKVNQDRVEFLRPRFVPNLHVVVRGTWDPQSGSLLRMSGNFGIISLGKENWREAQGKMELMANSIKGHVDQIKVELDLPADMQSPGQDKIYCTIQMQFQGNAISSGKTLSA